MPRTGWSFARSMLSTGARGTVAGPTTALSFCPMASPVRRTTALRITFDKPPPPVLGLQPGSGAGAALGPSLAPSRVALSRTPVQPAWGFWNGCFRRRFPERGWQTQEGNRGPAGRFILGQLGAGSRASEGCPVCPRGSLMPSSLLKAAGHRVLTRSPTILVLYAGHEDGSNTKSAILRECPHLADMVVEMDICRDSKLHNVMVDSVFAGLCALAPSGKIRTWTLCSSSVCSCCTILR